MDDFNPDAALAQLQEPQQDSQLDMSTFDPDEALTQIKEEKYGGLGQTIKAGLEGALAGAVGPLAPILEKSWGVKPEDILGRAEESPIVRGIGEAATLIGGVIGGTGLGGTMAKAGQLATEAIGLGKAAETATIGVKIGEAAVQQAAEMAILQGSNEANKLILQDPDTSAETALSNIGLAAVLGAGGGALMGAASPLWKATIGPKANELLTAIKDHANGTGAVLPEATEAAMTTLGVDAAPAIRAGLSKNPKAVEEFRILKEVQNKEIVKGLDQLNRDTGESVMKSLGVDAEDMLIYDKADAGHDLLSTFKKEYTSKYEPVAAKLQARDAEAAVIAVSDEARMGQYGKMLEKGMTEVGTDSPYYKLYDEYGNRLLAKDTIGGMDKLKTEINGRLSAAKRGGDFNEIKALNDIKSSIADFQEQQIVKSALQLEKQGAEAGAALGRDLVAERASANAAYRDFASMSDELASNLGIGGFRGAGSLQAKLAEQITPEQLLNKFSIKNNADFIPFLQKYFPETLQEVKDHELRQFIKPAILGAKGEAPVNLVKLHKTLEKMLSEQKSYVDAILPAGAVEKIQAAKTIADALITPKSSGTAGWMTKTFSGVPRSVMAMIAMLTGHNPFIGALMGEASQRLGRDVPDAIRLSYLKYLGSNQPIKSEGFKAMVDFFHAVQKGETLLNKSIGNVFKPGMQILTASQVPNDKDLKRLDKEVDKMQATPGAIMQSQGAGDLGHYLAEHQTAMSRSTMTAVQYLMQLKPHPYKLSPLDQEIKPSPIQEARYKRALTIAQQPAVILQHVKDGTIQPTDMQDISSMYPYLYNNMQKKMSTAMLKAHDNEELLPYKTRMGISLFLGQPMDSTMTPASIQSAQPMPKEPQQPQSGEPMKGRKGTSSLGKNNKSYQTPLQGAELDKSSRD